MSRPAARIRHDEVVRMVKAVRACGLPVSRITFDGNRLDVVIGDSGDENDLQLDAANNGAPVKEVPTL